MPDPVVDPKSTEDPKPSDPKPKVAEPEPAKPKPKPAKPKLSASDPKPEPIKPAEPKPPTTFALDSKEVKDAIRAGIEAETSGLKENRDEILRELKENKKKHARYDFDKIDVMLTEISRSEEARMISEGKFDEVIENRTNNIRDTYEQQLTDVQSELEASRESEKIVKAQYEDKVIADAIRNEAIAQGIRPEALTDAVTSANGLFVVKEGNLTPAENNTDKPSPAQFIKSLKEAKPYYWPESADFELTGSQGDVANLTDRITDAAEAHDFEGYKKLREAKK